MVSSGTIFMLLCSFYDSSEEKGGFIGPVHRCIANFTKVEEDKPCVMSEECASCKLNKNGTKCTNGNKCHGGSLADGNVGNCTK